MYYKQYIYLLATKSNLTVLFKQIDIQVKIRIIKDYI